LTLLTISQAVAKNIGIEPPQSIQSTNPDAVKLVQFINEAGSELARRVDWNALTRRHQITGVGVDQEYALAPDHDRFADGMCVSADGYPIRGGLSADEWFSLTPVDGMPRFFRSANMMISFYPYPMLGQDIFVSYQSKNWAKDASGDAKPVMDTDGDESFLPDELLQRGAIWRFLRHLGRDFSDYLAEYEAAIVDYAVAENGERQP